MGTAKAVGKGERVSVNIHPTAIVGKAEIGEGTSIGPYAVIEDGVVIGKNCRIENQAMIRSHSTLGDEVTVHPYAVVGGAPQHLGYKNEPTKTIIGNQTVLREYCTVNRGTVQGHGETIVGPNCFLMAYTHVAHDCKVGRGVIIANSVHLAGHAEIGDFVTLGGQSAVAQFCRVGMYSYIGGGSIIRKDVAPFCLAKGWELSVAGINSVGLQRKGFNEITVARLKRVFKIFFLQKLQVEAALKKIADEIGDGDEVRIFVDFVQSSKLGISR